VEIHGEELTNQYLGEAHFLRAFYYFGMVKRYGGVPIIKEVQDPAAPLEELWTPRSTEYDSWKFIYEDLKFAMANMAEESVTGRANRYSAAALMTRAMLYAGFNGKLFRDVEYYPRTSHQWWVDGYETFAGCEFYEYVIEAAELIERGGYRLHDGLIKKSHSRRCLPRT